MDIPRITAESLRGRIKNGLGVLLVCGYDTDERFEEMKLEGAISWPTFRSRLPSVAQDQEIVFYCA